MDDPLPDRQTCGDSMPATVVPTGLLDQAQIGVLEFGRTARLRRASPTALSLLGLATAHELARSPEPMRVLADGVRAAVRQRGVVTRLVPGPGGERLEAILTCQGALPAPVTCLLRRAAPTGPLAAEGPDADLLDAMVEGAEDGLLVLDAGGVLLHLNARAARLAGLQHDHAPGAHLDDLPAVSVDWTIAGDALRRGIPVAGTRRLPGGRTLLVSARPVPRRSRTYVVVTLRDVSETSRLMERFQQSAETARRVRGELHAATVSQAHARRVVGQSAPMRAARDLAVRYAVVDLPVLLLGETGTGKGLFAELIHQASARARGPFLQVNCGALPESLIEAELFGYVRGAFSGADARGKAGLVELAEAGTLLLDEIGDLPLAVQVKLLHLLERGEIRPVGAGRARRPDVRIIAATNRDLAAMVTHGTFRADLFYRLDVLTIRLPPLREHLEDLPELVEAMLGPLGARLSRRPRLGAAVLERLARYRFPGNVRELSNLIERLVVTAQGDTIEPADLPPEIGTPDEAAGAAGPGPLRAAVRRVEAALLREALERYGTQERAARYLGVGQATVARKVKLYRRVNRP